MAIADTAHAGETEEIQETEPIDAAGLQALLDRAVQLEENGQVDEALGIFEGAVEHYGNQPELLCNLGVAYQKRGRHEDAVAAFDQVTVDTPAFAVAHNARGNSLQELGRFDEAIAAYNKALALDPKYPDALNNRGIAYQQLGKYQEAGESHVAAIQMAPGFLEAYNSLGVALIAITDFNAALQVFDRALSMNPNYRDALNNRGMCLHQLGRLEEAIESFNRVMDLTPGGFSPTEPTASLARFNRGLAELYMGDFDAGWADYEYRSLAETRPRYPICMENTWKGEHVVGGTIYVRSEQGYGDTIQMIRFLPKVRARCAKVILECPQELAQLFTTSAGVDEIVVSPGRGKMWATPEGAHHVFVGSLPGIFKTRLTNIPSQIPYLGAPDDRLAPWQDRIESHDPGHASLRVGIVWAGSTTNSNDARRSCSLDDYAPLAKMPGVKLFSLQKGSAADTLVNSPLKDTIIDLSTDIADFADTAAAIEEMDLVITIDTAVAHLAGALSTPVWLLIDKYCDWRWLRDREDTPWYPTMRIFRKVEQEAVEGARADLRGTWRQTIDRVASELETMKKSA